MSRRPNRHKNSAVVLAYVRPVNVPGRFCDDLSGLVLFDSGNHRYLAPPGGTIALQSSPRIAEARSQVVDNFLHHENFKGAEWLFWLDADASFDKDILARLMDQAHAEERPIVGALAFGGSNPDNAFPTIYSLTNGDTGWEMDKVYDYPRDALVKVGATGCHCVIVHRSVFVKMAHAFSKLSNGAPNQYPWYSEGHMDSRGRPLGEDVAFCMKAQALDIPVYVDTSIKTGHVKEVILSEELWDKTHHVIEPVADAPPEYRQFKIA